MSEYASICLSLNMAEYCWVSLNMTENAWINCSDYASVLDIPRYSYNNIANIVILLTIVVLTLFWMGGGGGTTPTTTPSPPPNTHTQHIFFE